MSSSLRIVASARAFGAAVIAAAIVSGAPAGAHEIPADVTIRMFLKAEGHQIRVLVRVPLEAMRDVDLPLRGPGYLDLAGLDVPLREAAQVWLADNLTVFDAGTPLPRPRLTAVRVSLPSDRAFDSYDRALAHLSGRLPDHTALVWNQAMLDALLEYDLPSDATALAIDPRFSRLGLRVTNVVRYLLPDGTVRAYQFTGDGGRIGLDPRWHQAALQFVGLGVAHILGGVDHLLFLVALVIPIRGLRALVVVATAFTLAHSLTLIASAFGLAPDALWFPALVETVIALSIVYTSLENIVCREAPRRWLTAFVFGLAHGFGFSMAFRGTLQFSGGHLLVSLLAFNVGVELGQLAVLVALGLALNVLFRRVTVERVATIVLSALVAHTGLHWSWDRAMQLQRYPWGWPVWDAGTIAVAMRWAMLLIVSAGLVRAFASVACRPGGRSPRRGTVEPATVVWQAKE